MKNNIESYLPPPDFKDDDPELEAKKIHYQAILNLSQSAFDSAVRIIEAKEIEKLKDNEATWANEYKLAQSIHDAYIDVAKNQLRERLNRAEFIQKTAGAISGVYVAVLGLSFSVKDDAPLPSKGIIPAIFLGLALFLSAVYASFLTESGEMKGPISNGRLGTLQPARLNTFILWTIHPVLKRKYWLQAAVISLGIGVLLLPLPYIAIADWFSFVALVIGLLITFLFPIIIDKARKMKFRK